MKRARSETVADTVEQEVAKTSKEAKEQSEADRLAKRAMTTMQCLIDEHTCPITGALMKDPVTAEDGRWYERTAIEAWFAKQPSQSAKSPVTGIVMGFRLLSNVQARNVIAKLVEAGACSSDEAKAYKEGLENREALDRLHDLSKKGCTTSMAGLGYVYRDAMYGQAEHKEKAFQWFKCAADKGHVDSATAVGICYLNGTGVEMNRSQGMLYLSQGAHGGSEHAAAVLGWAFDNGNHGLGVDPDAASYWYNKMKTAHRKDSVQLYKDRAETHLKKHPFVEPALPPKN